MMKDGIVNNLYVRLFPIPRQLFSKFFFADINSLDINNTFWKNYLSEAKLSTPKSCSWIQVLISLYLKENSNPWNSALCVFCNFLISAIYFSGFGQKRKLSEYVGDNYTPLTYDPSEVHNQHHRHKRSLPDPETGEHDHRVRVQFSSHGRYFDLSLQRDHSVFHNNLVVERGDDVIAADVDLSHIYEGELVNEPGSYCFGAIRNGVFDGQIQTPSQGIYYVERANRYFNDEDAIIDDDLDNTNTTNDDLERQNDKNKVNMTTSKKKFHSVIYHESHLIDPFHHSKKCKSSLFGI